MRISLSLTRDPGRPGLGRRRPSFGWARPGKLIGHEHDEADQHDLPGQGQQALDEAEDPRETLDYSYQRQLEMLTKVRRGVADVATSRKRIELQRNQLQTQSDKLTEQAQKALSMDREDLAREALTRKSALTGQIADLDAQHAQLQGEEEKLTLASQRLQAKVESFRTRKETIKATYTAAEAQTRIGEAFSGISEEMGDVGHGGPARRGQDPGDAGPRRRDRRADRLRRPRRRQLGQPRRRHQPRAGVDELPVRRRGRAGRAQGRQPAGHRRARDPGHRATPQDTVDEAAAQAEPRGREGAAGMIVRILGEGQLEVADDQLETLNDPRQRRRVRGRDRRRGRLPVGARAAFSTAYAAPARRSPRTRSTTPT